MLKKRRTPLPLPSSLLVFTCPMLLLGPFQIKLYFHTNDFFVTLDQFDAV